MESFSQKPSHITVTHNEAHDFGNKCTVCQSPATITLQIGAHWGVNALFHFCSKHRVELHLKTLRPKS